MDCTFVPPEEVSEPPISMSIWQRSTGRERTTLIKTRELDLLASIAFVTIAARIWSLLRVHQLMAGAMLAPFKGLAAARALEASAILAVPVILPYGLFAKRHVSCQVSASRGAGGAALD